MLNYTLSTTTDVPRYIVRMSVIAGNSEAQGYIAGARIAGNSTQNS